MSLGDLLEDVRQYYINRFMEAADKLLSNQNVSLVMEPALRDADGATVLEGVLQLPLRADFAILQDGAEPKLLTIQTDRMLAFETISFQWGGKLRVHLSAFQWDAMRLRLRLPVRENVDWRPLEDWFLRWFKEEEEEQSDPESLLGAVHYLSDPAAAGDEIHFTVDLGSAPVEALEELLDASIALEASHCDIGQPVSPEQPKN
jgi:hypothetical protein